MGFKDIDENKLEAMAKENNGFGPDEMFKISNSFGQKIKGNEQGEITHELREKLKNEVLAEHEKNIGDLTEGRGREFTNELLILIFSSNKITTLNNKIVFKALKRAPANLLIQPR